MKAKRRVNDKRFVVMVPHRDVRPAVEAYRARLFSAAAFRGMPLQVWAFPAVVPLAAVERPLARGELGLLAETLRRARDSTVPPESGRACVFSTLPKLDFVETEDLLLWGFPLNRAPEITGDYFLPEKIFPSLILGVFITGKSAAERELAWSVEQAIPEIRFRAAAAANLMLTALNSGDQNNVSFAWELGAPRWLPKA
jgi:hypothetical protein